MIYLVEYESDGRCLVLEAFADKALAERFVECMSEESDTLYTIEAVPFAVK